MGVRSKRYKSVKDLIEVTKIKLELQIDLRETSKSTSKRPPNPLPSDLQRHQDQHQHQRKLAAAPAGFRRRLPPALMLMLIHEDLHIETRIFSFAYISLLKPTILNSIDLQDTSKRPPRALQIDLQR